jgi:hypothetical protein
LVFFSINRGLFESLALLLGLLYSSKTMSQDKLIKLQNKETALKVLKAKLAKIGDLGLEKKVNEKLQSCS